jgi:hypothetical protein
MCVALGLGGAEEMYDAVAEQGDRVAEEPEEETYDAVEATQEQRRQFELLSRTAY